MQVQYPDLSEEDLKELFPAKALISINKLSNRAQAYLIDDELLFFDPEGRGDYLIPTVYALWRFPHMLPTVYTHSQVSTKVRGCDHLHLESSSLKLKAADHEACNMYSCTQHSNDASLYRNYKMRQSFIRIQSLCPSDKFRYTTR